MSEVSVDEYIISFGQAKEALSVAIDRAETAGGNSGLSKQQQADAVALASDLGAQLVVLVGAHNRFMTKFFLPNPPSQVTVDDALGKMRKLAQVVADNILAEGKLEAVIGIISAINELAKPAAAAAAPAGELTGVEMAPLGVAGETPSGPELVMAGTTTYWLRQMRKRQ